MPSSITVKTNGQTLSVNASISHWTTAALANAASTSNDVEPSTWTTITSDYTLYFANTAQFVTVTVKQLDGSTLHTGTYKAGPGAGARVVEPLPSSLQVAADLKPGAPLVPAVALAETFPRTFTMSNSAALTSGQLKLAAIALPAGLTVSSISFLSATTALSAGTNQWFALYNSAYALLAQTTDDTNTAWGANTVKTLSFSTPFVTTYAGLHYLGIMVAASTAPSLFASVTNSVPSGITPRICPTADGSLTTTAPATAGSIATAAYLPYAYVS